MTQLERADLHAAIETRYPDNTSEDITPLRLRQGLHELVDSVFVTATDTGAVPNVPDYQPGTFYVVGYTVRYTPLGGSEGFYAAKTAGKHPAPGPGNLLDWKVVPGPVTPTALSQALTLSQAQGLDQAGVVAGREYLIDCGLDAAGHQQMLTVRGLANEFFDVEGTLEVNGVRTAVTDFKVQAGTWTVKQYGGGGVTPADLATKEDALLIRHSNVVRFDKSARYDTVSNGVGNAPAFTVDTSTLANSGVAFILVYPCQNGPVLDPNFFDVSPSEGFRPYTKQLFAFFWGADAKIQVAVKNY